LPGLGEQVAEATKAGADLIHVDVMDGHFVPQITFGGTGRGGYPEIYHTAAGRPSDDRIPEDQIAQFARAGADIITVHIEPCPHIHRVIQLIKNTGVKAGISINPATSLSMIDEILPEVDLVLVMSVNPGFGGQTFIESTLDKSQGCALNWINGN